MKHFILLLLFVCLAQGGYAQQQGSYNGLADQLVPHLYVSQGIKDGFRSYMDALYRLYNEWRSFPENERYMFFYRVRNGGDELFPYLNSYEKKQLLSRLDSLNTVMQPQPSDNYNGLLALRSRLNEELTQTSTSVFATENTLRHIPSVVTGTLTIMINGQPQTINLQRDRAKLNIIPQNGAYYNYSNTQELCANGTGGFELRFQTLGMSTSLWITYKGREYSYSLMDGTSDTPIPFLSASYVNTGTKELCTLVFGKDQVLSANGRSNPTPGASNITVRKGSYLIFETALP